MFFKFANLWHFSQNNSWFAQFVTEAQSTRYSSFIAQHSCDILLFFCLKFAEVQVVS